MTISRNLSILAEGVSSSGVLAVTNGGTGVTTSTGTGSTVLSASPTLTGTLTVPTVTSPSATALTIQSAGTTAMTVDTSQNVGIGTTSPLQKLQVNGSIYMSAGNGTAVSWASDLSSHYVKFDSTLNGLIMQGYGGLAFYTGGANERMRVDSSGNLLVGTTTTGGTGFSVIPANGGAGVPGVFSQGASSSAGNTYHVYSTTAAAYRFYVGYNGTINATNTTISAISDQRLKENIVDLDIGLDKIMLLKPRKFDWKTGKGKDIKGDRGFIAQEFEQVFPELIDEWLDPAPEGEEAYKSVRADLIPIFVKAIQELSAKNDALEARVAALEGK